MYTFYVPKYGFSNFLIFFKIRFNVFLLQESDLRQQVEILKQQRAESIQRIAHLKQQITEIETQENEAIREVSIHIDVRLYTSVRNVVAMEIFLTT